jgi:hypothetical protein
MANTKPITREDAIQAVGPVDDVTLAKIIGSGATLEELAEAQAWTVNDEPLINDGRPLPSGRVGELIDILLELSATNDEEAGPETG